jgi:hypothetical protein
MTYGATATREERFWVIDIAGVGVTQGRTVAEAKEMARDLVSVMTDVAIEDVRVEIDFQVGGVSPVDVRGARQAVTDAAEAQERAAQISRQMVAKLRGAGVSGRDVAGILGLSPQRVSQLANSDRTGKAAAAEQAGHSDVVRKRA